MGLIIPKGPDWAYCTHNLPPEMNATSVGVACTSGTSNADGSPVALFSAALAHDVEYLRLVISGAMPGSGNNDLLMDVLIDPAGGTSWTELIPDLITGALGGTEGSGSNPSGHSMRYDFPIWVPAGASLGIQARSAHSVASTLTVTAFAFGGNANPASWWCGQRVTGIGINAASSTGTAITPGGVAVSGAADNGSGLVRLTVPSTALMLTGETVIVAGITGTSEANGTWLATVIDGTHIDLQGSTFANAYIGGGRVSGFFSSWENLGSPLTAPCGALQFGVNGVGGTFYQQCTHQFEFGVGGVRIGPPIFRTLTSNEAGWSTETGPIFKSLATGTQFQARAKSGSNTNAPQALGVAVYAVH